MQKPPIQLIRHLEQLSSCTRCPKMHKPVVVGRPVVSKIVLVGQAPGTKEPQLGRPFAWTAGKTLFKWMHTALGWDEDTVRTRIYFAAVCRCFPGKNPKGGDRVPDLDEITACSHWLKQEISILKPSLILPIGKLAISQFLTFKTLNEVIGEQWSLSYNNYPVDIIPLPHPSGASTWHRTEPGITLLNKALHLITKHVAAS